MILMLLMAGGQFAFHHAIAQDEENETFPVMETFRNTQLINAQTVEMLQPGGYEFKIQHRFGEIGFDERFYKEYLGLALGANIRLSLAFPLTERFYTGIGWTRNNKIIDIDSKFLLLKQTEENEMPVSVAVYFNAAINTDEFPLVPNNAYFSDSITAFKYELAHRLYYNTQIIIARKFSERFSLQVTPVFIYKNLVAAGKDNHAFVLPVSGRFKVTNNNSIIFEYAYIFNKEKVFGVQDMSVIRDPVSIGYEIATSGHVFQLIMSSSNNIPEQEIYTNNSVDYLSGNFHLGFNIKRMLFKPKLPVRSMD